MRRLHAMTLHRALQTAVLLAGACAASGCSNAEDALPVILRGATSGSGYDSACPARSAKEAERNHKLAISPEFNQRLLEAFPPGTAEETLTNFLAMHRFSFHGSCDTNPLVRRASFKQKGKGLLAYDTHAQVFWEVDVAGKLVWTKGSSVSPGFESTNWRTPALGSTVPRRCISITEYERPLPLRP
ncbi:hypothetical protein [Variovorax ginsengisoli]|uniref:Lipoprotein n=1 Tax=Variovorax ginsengisoli TaxID=363844 RepID=A0ABT8SIZ4_9BURK|nr:hypothetical protein [Variovorax ginsengisoli]MDN8618957.1 hypothetical protein [Variovorax ginsengisoli]MDO1538127.1 hypothetical protein [Variovorax ginsengisoli]